MAGVSQSLFWSHVKPSRRTACFSTLNSCCCARRGFLLLRGSSWRQEVPAGQHREAPVQSGKGCLRGLIGDELVSEPFLRSLVAQEVFRKEDRSSILWSYLAHFTHSYTFCSSVVWNRRLCKAWLNPCSAENRKHSCPLSCKGVIGRFVACFSFGNGGLPKCP